LEYDLTDAPTPLANPFSPPRGNEPDETASPAVDANAAAMIRLRSPFDAEIDRRQDSPEADDQAVRGSRRP
jgi:hypothetical protein